MSRIKVVKRSVYFLWLATIVVMMIWFLLNPSSFSPEYLADFLSRYAAQAMIVYALISILRGLFLIPSTPFVLAGALLFPDDLWTVFVISMIGVIVGSSAVYFFSDLLGFSKKLERKYPKQLEKWHRRLNSPGSVLIVIAWSFFPFVPTDLICYVAGIVKMPFRYVLAGVFIGEAVLVYCYVFLGSGIFQYLMG